MTALLVLVVVVPLLAAAATAALPGALVARRVIALAAQAGVVAGAAGLVVATSGGEVLVSRLGGWGPAVAIPLVADAFAALLLLASSVVTLACTAYAAAGGADRTATFHPVALAMSAGAYGAFLVGDLFSLFVFVEVMVVPSFVLLATAASARTSALYVAVSLLASTLLVAGVGLVYATAGTTNLAALAALADRPGVTAAAAVVAVALAAKAAVVPVHWWLPRVYPAAPPVVTAMFSALLTKVGVYGLYRLASLLPETADRVRGVLVVVAVVTMVVGVVEAVGHSTMRSILAAHMVSQVGYLLVGLALWTVAGLTAAVVYTVQYVLVKAALLLVAAAVEDTQGSGALDRLGGLARQAPWLAAVFGVAAAGLAGLPPTGGFVGKLLLAQASFDAAAWALGAAVVAVSVGTLTSMVKIWTGVFWGDAPPTGTARVPARLVVPAAVLAVAAFAAGPFGEGLLGLATTAAQGLHDPSSYLEAVLAP